MDYRHIHFAGSHRVHAGRVPARTLTVPPVCESTAEIDPLTRRVMELSGLQTADYQPSALRRRLPACLRALRCRSLEQALELIERDRRLVPRLASTLLLGVTEFFRDKQVFSAIESHVLPAVLQRTRRPAIWSAACSDGQELYSVAMLLSRVHSIEQAFLLGTDCRRESIAAAIAGTYPISAAASIPASLRQTWIIEQKDKLQIAPELRDRLSWRVSNLLSETPPGRWHLVLWRNMAIYLSHAGANRAWTDILRSLEPGGFLVTGKAERPPAHLSFVRLDRCIYQKPA